MNFLSLGKMGILLVIEAGCWVSSGTHLCYTICPRLYVPQVPHVSLNHVRPPVLLHEGG